MGGKRGHRKPVVIGVYQDRYGFGIPIRGKEHRFPLGTPKDQLLRARNELREAAGAIPDRRGTLAAAAASYLQTIPEGPRRRDVTTMLQHWLDAPLPDQHGAARGSTFGKHALDGIKPIDIRTQLAAWPDFSLKTKNDLRQVLGAVFTAVNGKSGYNPVRDVKRHKIRYDEPRGMPYEIIEKILSTIPDKGRPTGGGKGTQPKVNLSKLRLYVMAYTGLSPAMLKRVEPRDFDPKAKTVFVRPRKKGEGVDAAMLTLLDPAVKAFKDLAKAKAFGKFNTRSVAYVWTRAVKRTRTAWEKDEAKKKTPRPWPIADDARPYDLRHSFGTLMLGLTGDLDATATLLRHASTQQTRRYTQAAAALRAQKAIATVNKSFRR